MKIAFPEYYEQFSCIADACEDSCCKEWEVDVDEDSATFYQQLPGELGDRLRKSLRQEDGCTLMTVANGRCPMWRQDGLCEIQAQYGHEALCQTCRQYPRLKHDYGDYAELDLALSCPEAARLIFSGSQAILTKTEPGGEAAEYDVEAMKILLHTRRNILELLDTGSTSLPQALSVMLLYSHAVQAELDGGEAARMEPEAFLGAAEKYAKAGNIDSLIEFFSGLEILTARWQQRLDSPAPSLQWDPLLMRFVTYAVRRYWLQAVSDCDLVCRVKFIISACLLITALGGDTVATAQLFSKEIESDPDNMDAILDAAYTASAFTDVNLLSLLQA